MVSTLYLFAILAAAGAAQDTTGAPVEQPLFQSHELLEFRIVANFTDLLRDVGKDRKEHRGTISYMIGSGDTISLQITLETRGNFRRDKKICNFPPLRVDFKKKEFDSDQARGTLFANQNKLKLVCHCQDKKDSYEQSTLQEYLIYRTLNILTDKSFRVRLGRFIYIDSAGKRNPLTKYAFFIEDDDLMARRMGSEIFDQQGIHPLDAEFASTTLLAVFQYMILNTDWSISGLHNIKLVGPLDGTVYPIPYDFDWAGVINAPYARPDRSLGIRSVRNPLFMGYCRAESELEQAFAVFNRNQEKIYALHRRQVGLDERRLQRMLQDYDRFYRTINRPRLVQQTILRQCKKR
ncbi:MAG: hypothetical protein ACE5HT_11510 [Gemmatimonadales bacterium]